MEQVPPLAQGVYSRTDFVIRNFVPRREWRQPRAIFKEGCWGRGELGVGTVGKYQPTFVLKNTVQ
jgi:hypothetical protein